MEEKEYHIFLNGENRTIIDNWTRRGTPEMLRADLPEAAIIPADEVPANWKEMSVRNGQLVAASAEVLAARRQAESARIQQQTGLTEKVVPGEFWLDADGVRKRQVYQQTFVGTTAASTGQYSTLVSGVKAFRIENACVFSGTNAFGPGFIYHSGGTFSNNYLYHIYNSERNVILSIYGPSIVAKPYSVTLKYTKA